MNATSQIEKRATETAKPASRRSAVPNAVLSKRPGQLTLVTLLPIHYDASGRPPASVPLASGMLPIVTQPGTSDNDVMRYREPNILAAMNYTGAGSQGHFAMQTQYLNRSITDRSVFYQPRYFSFAPFVEGGPESGSQVLRTMQSEDIKRDDSKRVFLGSWADKPNMLIAKYEMVMAYLKQHGFEVPTLVLEQLEASSNPFDLLLQYYPAMVHHIFHAMKSLQVLYASAWLRFGATHAAKVSRVAYIRYNPEQIELREEKYDRWMMKSHLTVTL